MKGFNHGKPISEETRDKMSRSAERTLNGFKKGHKTNVGSHFSEETKKKMSETAKSQSRSSWQPKGYKHSDDTKNKLRISFIGRPSNQLGKEHPYMKSESYRRKVSMIMKKIVVEGRHNFWKGGITEINKSVRTRLEYKLWREAVYKRDNYTCIECKQHGGKLNAHHIKPFSLFPELRYAIDNGVTLCIDCHRKTDSYGNRIFMIEKQLLINK